jgi:hypothetical protein
MAISFAAIRLFAVIRQTIDEGSIADALPTVVGETQEGKGLRFSLSALLPISSGKPRRLPTSARRPDVTA